MAGANTRKRKDAFANWEFGDGKIIPGLFTRIAAASAANHACAGSAISGRAGIASGGNEAESYTRKLGVERTISPWDACREPPPVGEAQRRRPEGAYRRNLRTTSVSGVPKTLPEMRR